MKSLAGVLKIANQASLVLSLTALSITTVNAEPTGPPPAIARVLAITVDGKIKAEAANDEALIKRADQSKTAEAVKDGMELFANDEVVTFGKTSIALLFLNPSPDKNNEILLGPNSTITISSATCNFVCRWLAKLKDAFDGRNRSVVLSNESTEYEFATFEDGSSSLIVYEGVVDVTKRLSPGSTGAGATGNPTPRLLLASRFVAAVKVPSLNQVKIAATGDVVEEPKKMTAEETRMALAWSSAAIIAMHPGDPTKGSEGISKYSSFKSEPARNLAFTEARFQSVWDQDPGSFIKLGQVYNDWSEGRKATELYARAEQLYRKNDPAWQPSADLLLAKAEASRLIGEYDAAAGMANSAIQKDPKLGEVGKLVLGNIKYSQAIAIRNGGNPEAARFLLRDAANAYSASFDMHQTNEYLARTNLVVTFQSLGNINAATNDKKSLTRAGSWYLTAAELFEDSQKMNPDNPLAKIARADIFVVRGAMTQQRTGGAGTNESYASAETLYREVINQNPQFAPAYKGLANLYEIRGQSDEAEKNYELWAALSPKWANRVVEVPALTGKSKLAALQILTSAGLIPSTTGQGDWIASQGLASGARVPAGTKVSVRLGNSRLVEAGAIR